MIFSIIYDNILPEEKGFIKLQSFSYRQSFWNCLKKRLKLSYDKIKNYWKDYKVKEVQKRLLSLADNKYAEFQAKLIPTVAPVKIIGVRVPVLRRFCKEFEKDPICCEFLNTLPHEYYDENLLHSILLGRLKDYNKCIAAVETFLPYIDNWAVCDILSPKVFSKYKSELLQKIKEWVVSEKTYICRFGINMLMTHYLDKDFKEGYLEIPASVKSEEYYVRMMAAWYYATALAKQWDAIIPYIEGHRLPEWTHNKTIQKACESNRITNEQKAYLKTLR